MSLEVGTVVQMTRDAPYKEYKVFKGDIGIINYVAKTGKYSIHIYGKFNPHIYYNGRSCGEDGDFWIPFEYVKKYNCDKGESNMKLSGYNKVAAIEYCNKDYYYALYDNDVEIGDNVLVTGQLVNKQDLTVKDIITLDKAREVFSGSICEEVKCKVDLSAYNRRIECRKEAEKLREKMDEEIKKMDELNKYEMYADRNPVLREMLEQLKSLGV